MNNSHYFPVIAVQEVASGFKATVVVILKSLLKGNLMEGKKDLSPDGEDHVERIDPRSLHGNRVAFLSALAQWPENTFLELRITSLPDLACKAQGNLSLAVYIHARAESVELAKEEVISRYISLMPLLTTYFPEAEFLPVTDASGSAVADLPTAPAYALAVQRRIESISLSNPLPKHTVGLIASSTAGEHSAKCIQHCFPWLPSFDDWSRLLDMLLHRMDPAQVIIRLQKAYLTEKQRRAMENTIRQCEQFLATGESYQLILKRQVEMIRDITLQHLIALMETAFHLGVFVVAPYPSDRTLGSVVGQSITGQRLGGKERNVYQGGFQLADVPVRDALREDYFPEPGAFCASEAAAAFRLPSPPLEDRPGIPLRRSRTGFAMLPKMQTLEAGSVELFLNKHQQMGQPIRIGAHDRMRHTFIIGQTGTGKSTLMESMIIQDIRGGQGLAVIDPHGDMIDSILGKIPPERTEDVIIFDVLDRDHPVGFNILEWATIDERDLIIDEIYTTIDHLYDMKLTGGPIFESNLRGMLKLLIGDRKHDDFTPTILNFINCYLHKDFRTWLKSRVSDPTIHDFVKELERTGGDARLENLSPYITSKFGRYINDTTLMRIIGQEKTSFDFNDIMNKGKILLVKLGKGRFGSHVSALLANMIVSRFKYAGMKRGDLPPEHRRDFYLYVDEAHNLPSENFTELLAEARKFRMGLILATQYAAQLSSRSGKNDFLAAVIGNVGTIVAFRLGQDDAKNMAPVFHPNFNSLDIIGLPNWQGYARLQQGGDTVPPFSFHSLRDETPFNKGVAANLIDMSRRKYAKSIDEVDARIAAQRTSWKKSEADES